MARFVKIKISESNRMVTYPVGIPDDVMFFEKEGILYAQWWNMSRELVTIPVWKIISIQ